MQQRILLQILLLAQHVSGHHYAHHQELKSIIQWLLPVVFRAVIFKLLVWCGAEGLCVRFAGCCSILNSALDGVVVHRHAPAALPLGKTRYPLYTGVLISS